MVEVGWVNGLAAIRSLGRSGVRTFAVDHRPWALGFKSRYAHRVIAPEPVTDEDGFIAAMAALGQRFDGPTPVFATHDEHLNVMVKRSAELSEHYRFPAPSWPLLEALQRKRHQIETARASGVGIPDTRYPASAARGRRRRGRDGLSGVSEAVATRSSSSAASNARRSNATPPPRSPPTSTRWWSSSRCCRSSCPAGTTSCTRSAAT